MLTSTVQSAPCATPEAANDALSGLLVQAGQNQTVKVISTDVHEVDGLWIAVAFFQIEQLEEEDELDEEKTNDPEKDAEGIKPSDDSNVLLWHGMTREQVPEESPAKDFPDTDPIPTPTEPIPQEFLTDSTSSEADGAETSYGQENDPIKVAEDLQNDFKKAEEADDDDMREQEPAPASAPIYIPLPGTEIHVSDELTFEERRELEEELKEKRELEELERLRAQAAPLPIEAAPEPAPSDS